MTQKFGLKNTKFGQKRHKNRTKKDTKIWTEVNIKIRTEDKHKKHPCSASQGI
jgi:hypothetical protein